MVNRYDTWELMALIEELEPTSSFFLDTFFSRQVFSTAATVEFDVQVGGKRLAPFVSPMVQGRIISREGYATKSFKPAYLKPKSFVAPTDALVRMAGEPYGGGQMSPSQRMDRLMAQELATHNQMIDNRLEWMAAKLLIDGGYTVSGEDYAPVYVDFHHDPSLRVALAGAAQWNLATSAPLDDIENMAKLVRRQSRGAIVDTLVMDTLSWQYLRAHASIKDLLDVNYRRPTTTSLDIGPQNNIGAQYMGLLAGRFEIWTYEAYYNDDDGNDVSFMDPNTVLLISKGGLEGMQLFGAILDADANFQAVKMFSKSRSSFDPTGEELLTQSAPLVATRRANSWAKLTVA